MRPRVLLVDNYDSFTYNLAQALAVIGVDVTVKRHDEITVGDANALEPTHLMISPGPGRPEHAGVSIEMIEAMMGRIPILGVCLGHQAIAHALGGKIDHMNAFGRRMLSIMPTMIPVSGSLARKFR